METKTMERMDGLVLNQIANELKTAVRVLVKDFKEEGFEDVDIKEYICELVKGEFN